MRKLATIRTIDRIQPIEGADAIECAIVDGWRVVVKKGEYEADDLAVYCEIDSWIPTEIAPFLSKGKEPREFNGVKGERLRTVKLRGQLSQGLLLHPSHVAEHMAGQPLLEGMDVTDLLGIQKWEAEIPAQLAGQVRGPFPSAVPKTDQERIQNLVEPIREAFKAGLHFELTEKLEGSSCTFYMDLDGDFHVCSRNLDLKFDENNSLWRAALKYDVDRKLSEGQYYGFAFQGELVGPGIQGNIYKLTDVDFFVFDVYSVVRGQYLPPDQRRRLVEKLGLKHAPVLAIDKDLGTGEVDYILEWAEGKSALNEKQEREGIVFKQMDGGMTFKAISNKYLLGEK